jgi:hypothetical protein
MQDSTHRLIDVARPIRDEAFDRIRVDLSDADAAAISTAIVKAAIAGYRAGVASLVGTQHATIGDRTVEIQVTAEVHDDDPYDGWAEQYGGS